MERTYSGPLFNLLQNSINKDLEEDLFNILVTAEMWLDVLVSQTFNFDPECSGIIIQYCKAIEILEQMICEKIKDNLNIQINNLNPKFEKGKYIDIWLPCHHALNKMQDSTFCGFKDGKSNNIFYTKKAKDQILNYLNYGLNGGDIYMYNTLIFFYFHEDIDDNIFELLKNIYLLYHHYRCGAAHKDRFYREKGEEVKKMVVGDEDQFKSSILYNLLYNL